jgi:nucleotide-binding universal stress UspA family protein
MVMAFKKILCVLVGSPGEAAALDGAMAVAAATGGHVAALFVRNDPRDAIPMLGEGGMSAALVEQAMSTARSATEAEVAAAKALFAAAVGANGVTIADVPGSAGPTASWSEVTGRPVDLATKAARGADLIVLPRPSGAILADDMQIVEGVLLGGGRPVLLVPTDRTSRSIGSHVAIAWNGSVEAARAIAMSMDFITAASQRTVLTAGQDSDGHSAGAQLVEQLSWHRCATETKTVTAPLLGSIGSALLTAAVDAGADVLAMGGYGHSRLREMVLGGVTLHVITHSPLPVLLAH